MMYDGWCVMDDDDAGNNDDADEQDGADGDGNDEGHLMLVGAILALSLYRLCENNLILDNGLFNLTLTSKVKQILSSFFEHKE